MKLSRRARRMQRHHKQRKQPALNLVSLMDIFTILVFFLLVNSSSSEQLPNKKELVLPDSIADAAPKETLVITVTKSQLIVLGQSVGRIEDIMNSPSEWIPELKQELEFQASKTLVTEEAQSEREEGLAVTIMADENTPYELVSKIMTSCQQANYTNISFAATQIAKSKS